MTPNLVIIAACAIGVIIIFGVGYITDRDERIPVRNRRRGARR